MHYGTAVEVRAKQAETLHAAYVANPARFRLRRPSLRSFRPSPGPTAGRHKDSPARQKAFSNRIVGARLRQLAHWAVHSPATWPVMTFSRFQVLIAAMATISAASPGPS